MRIAFVTPTLHTGGYEKVVINYANELTRRGHQVDLLCGFASGELLHTLSPSVNIHDFQARARYFLFPLIRFLKRNPLDILYCGFRSYNCLGVLAKWLSGSRFCIYASQHGFQKDGRLEAWLKGIILRHADRLTAVTDAVAQFEAQQMHLPLEKFSMLPNPVLQAQTPVVPASHPWFTERQQIPVIVACQRIAKGKGTDLSVQILAHLNQILPVRMIFLGDGPELPAIKALAKAEHVNHLADFLGNVDHPMGYMRQSNLLLHTAYAEGFGNIIVEALASGIPVCCSSCTGPAYILEQGKYGMLLGDANAPDFVAKAVPLILKVLRHEVTYTGLKKRAMDFEIRHATDCFLALYRQQESQER